MKNSLWCLSLWWGSFATTDAFVLPKIIARASTAGSSCTANGAANGAANNGNTAAANSLLIMKSSNLINNDDDKNLMRVKKAGAGVPFVASGDRHSFWDPASEGMRGMDGDLSLEERLAFGIEFHLNGDYDFGMETETDNFKNISESYSKSSIPATTASQNSVPEMLHAAQCWLEHLDDNPNRVPPVVAKANKPLEAMVLGRTRLIDQNAPGDIQHIVLRLPENFHYVEGQSLSVIPPGISSKTNKPHKPRLYSIASTRYGDLLDGNTVSLCVRKAEYYDPSTGLPDPTKAGVCSGFLCGVRPGQKVMVAGPVGKTMVLPSDPSKDIIMVATGTGIAPFRSFLHRLYTEHTIARQQFTGDAWLILGVPTSGSLLYKPEFDAMLEINKKTNRSSSLTIDYAISREMTNAQGGKMYVQDVLTENAQRLFAKLESGAVVYFCGLKGMMPGILEALETVATAKNIDWPTKLKEYQSNHQWHVEVY